MRCRAFALGLGLLVGAAGSLAAQGDCFPPADSHEAAVFGKYAVPLAFSQGGPVAGLRPGAVRPAVEFSYLPRVDRVTATPTICRPGKGPEHVNLLPGLVRPRVALGLPAGFAAELAWVPPVRVSGVKANLVGLALSRVTPLGGFALGIRAEATLGVVHADITCDEAALQDPESECFGGTLSDDSYHPNILGIEATLGRRIGTRMAWYAGVGYSRLMPRFRVNFTNQFGETDRRRVEVDLDRLALSAGASWQLSPGLDLAGEIYSLPADAVTGRLLLRAGLGR